MTTAIAAEYPARPIRYIVPYGAGSGPDITVRLFTTELSRQMGQQIVIDNRPGAAGSIGTEMIVRAAPDGYTIGSELVDGTPEQFDAFVKSEIAKWAEVIRRSGAKVN